jgi:RNA polymerase sigma factor (sigma-70 family)
LPELRLASNDEEQDLHQQILAQIWKGLSGFERRSALGTWAYRTAMNAVYNYRRNTHRRNNAMNGYKETVETTMHGGRDIDAMFREFEKSLSDNDRDIFALYLSQLSLKEIAEIAGSGRFCNWLLV